MAAGIRYSFEFNEEMLKHIADTYPLEALVEEFVAAVKKGRPEENGIEILRDYGKRLALMVLKLGEEYSDRTYEILMEANEKTGGAYLFSLYPQRFLEIAYLSTYHLYAFDVLVNNRQELKYRIKSCPVYDGIATRLEASEAGRMQCSAMCRALAEQVVDHFGVKALFEQQSTMSSGGQCLFSIKKINA
jgi:hypothetical protein